MSANEKDRRASQKAERLERKAAAAAEQDKKDRRYRRNAIVVVVILVVLIAFALLINSDFFYTRTTALTVGSTRYSPAEVSYFYRSTLNGIYQNLYSQLGEYTSMILDTSSPLSEQTYPYGEDENTTWADAIEQSAREEMVRVTSLYDAAVAAGRTLTEEEKATIDSDVESLRAYATSNGYADLDKFLAVYFGKGMNEATYVRLMEHITLATAYSNDLEASFSYTPEELAAYYAEHEDELNMYYYYNYPLNSTDSAFEGLEGDELKAKMHDTAQEIADAATDLDSLTAAIREYTGENTVLTIAANPAGNIGSTYKDWVTDPARQKNDVAVFDIDNVSYVVLFIECSKNDYPAASFRHILAGAVADSDGNYTDDALEAAKAKAELLLDQWKVEPTEDNFAEIARLNSEDSGSTGNGGLYTDVTKYTMVPGVNNFLFEEGHTAGDTGIVFGQSSAYAGYHVMYYVGTADRNYCDELSEKALRSADYEAAYEQLSAGYEITEGSGMRYVASL